MIMVRKPAVAGLFYPADSKKLRSEIELLLSVAEPDIELNKIFGLIAPHAGYIYSGRTAAYAYNLVQNKKYKKVIIISPSHREYFPGACVYEGDAFETPLGIVNVDVEVAARIVSGSKLIFKGLSGHREEHAIEVQIPFLQYVLDEFKIIPIVMGDQRKIFIEELARKISEVADEDTLIVASSDLSHYHAKYEAFDLDTVVEENIKKFDFENLYLALESKKCEACGGGPIIAMMKAAKLLNKTNSVVLNRSDSSDVSGDDVQVVGYLSAAIYGN